MLPHKLTLVERQGWAERGVNIVEILKPKGEYHGLNVCIPHKIHMLKPNPQCNDIEVGLWEVMRS